MYGVPEELPLAGFVGQELDFIGLGRYQIQFRFSGGGEIDVQGGWQLVDPEGKRIDGAEEHEARDCYRLHRLLSLPVTGFGLDAPRSFTLVFGEGYRLTIDDDDPQYETFTLQLRGEKLWVV
jgi:hypothetical protein